VLIAQAGLANPTLNLEGLAFDNRIYALDSTTIDLCLEVFWWAKFRKDKLQILQSMNEILQILSVSFFNKTTENQLFAKKELKKLETEFFNQLNLFDL
jgi:hypothetical protein